MTERTKRIVGYTLWGVLLAGLIAAAVLAGSANARAREYERRLSAAYERSLAELAVNVGDIATSLKKTQVVAGARQYALLLSEIWRTSGEAASNLGQLPAGFARAAQTSAFLTQTSDFAHVLLQKVTDATPITAADMQQLYALAQSAEGLSAELQGLECRSEALADDLLSYDYYSAYDSADGEGGGAPTPAGENGGTNSNAEQSGAQSQGKYPTLIYDGPFSESTSKAEPLGLTGEVVTEAAAMARAAEFLGSTLAGALTPTGAQNGRIPTYGFTGKTADGRQIDIDITQTGGHCLSMRITGGAAADTARPDEARGKELAQIGQDYLAARGLTSMESTYAQYYGGDAVINYACVQDGVLLYSDLIKVWVNVQSGEVTGIEATNYYMSHLPRELPAPTVTQEQAAYALSTAVQVESVRMALIPLTLQDERLCYEFKCTFDGDYYIVYVNALTGMEEQVFLVLDSESGQLVV